MPCENIEDPTRCGHRDGCGQEVIEDEDIAITQVVENGSATGVAGLTDSQPIGVVIEAPIGNRVALAAGGVHQGLSQIRFADTDVAEDDDVRGVFNPPARCQPVGDVAGRGPS